MKTQDVVLKLIEIAKSPEPPVEEIQKLAESNHPVMEMFCVYIEEGGKRFHPLFEKLIESGIPAPDNEEIFWEKCKAYVVETNHEEKLKRMQEVRTCKAAPMFFLAGLTQFQNLSRETYLKCLTTLVAHGAMKAGLHVDDAIKCCQQSELDSSN
jgi:hypothetical protein